VELREERFANIAISDPVRSPAMRLLRLVFLAFAFALYGCGEATDSDGQADEGAPGSEQPDVAAEPTPACRNARRELVQSLESSLKIQGGGGLRRVRMVEVESPPEAPLRGFNDGVYIVAGEFTGSGMEGTLGTWAVSRDMVRTGGGLVWPWGWTALLASSANSVRRLMTRRLPVRIR
jgi:hypothetical protein